MCEVLLSAWDALSASTQRSRMWPNHALGRLVMSGHVFVVAWGFGKRVIPNTPHRLGRLGEARWLFLWGSESHSAGSIVRSAGWQTVVGLNTVDLPDLAGCERVGERNLRNRRK